MRKVFIAISLALSLAGCTTAQVSDTISAITVGFESPVTKQDLYNFENGMIIAFAGLNAYRRACIAGAVDINCRANIRAMQVYTRQIPPALARVRTFVKNNERINAATAYRKLKALYDQFRAIAIANGVKVS